MPLTIRVLWVFLNSENSYLLINSVKHLAEPEKSKTAELNTSWVLGAKISVKT